MRKMQVIVRINKIDFSAVNTGENAREAANKCLAEIQQLIYNELGIMPDDTTLRLRTRSCKVL